MEHIGAVSMGGEPLTIPVNCFNEGLFSFVGNANLCIWLAPMPPMIGKFKRKEILSKGGQLMSEEQLLSRIRCLQVSGADSWLSRVALRLLREEKAKLEHDSLLMCVL
ncbi:MAG: hypothetical protein HGA67_00890 [Candidatus Yonathbacteria bacterium]|nr:hypothetical protein [Candidatus Yonathbacteria bacterium]